MMKWLFAAGGAFATALVGIVILGLLGAATSSAGCGPNLSTGSGSSRVSLGTWNVCGFSCPDWPARADLASGVMLSAGPDVLAVQEGGWGKQHRRPTFRAAKNAGYANAHKEGPFKGRYVFFRPSKFDLVKAGGRSLGGNHGVSWARLKVKSDSRVFVVANVHLVSGHDAASDSKRGSQMREAVALTRDWAGSDPVVWAGDFNSNASRATDAPAAVLKQAGYVNALGAAEVKENQKVNSARGRGKRAPVKRKGHHVDQIWVEKNAQVIAWHQRVITDGTGKRYAPPFITDHNLVSAVIDVSGSGATVQTSDQKSDQTSEAPLKDFRGASQTWNDEQRRNAAIIARTGQDMGVPPRAQAIAIMTAMGESSLEVVDHGDAAGPDSRGLFQQRANGAWGSYADRMDPRISSQNFYKALLKVDGWQDMEPTIAAHKTQINRDPNHYAKFWADATAMLKDVAGMDLGSLDGEDCTLTAGYSIPINGVIHPIASGYSYIDRGNYGASGRHWKSTHTGNDYSAACGVPVLAAHDGVIEIDTNQPWSGPWLVKVSTGQGQLTTWYAHMQKIHVQAGDRVKAGEQIGDVGTRGNSTGCHLHFEVHVKGGGYGQDQVDPRQWLTNAVKGAASRPYAKV